MTGPLRPRRLLGHVYRACAAPFGRRALERMVRDGLPPRLVDPVKYLFTGQAPAAALAMRDRIERRRQVLAARSDTYGFSYTVTPHGRARWPVVRGVAPSGPVLSSRWLAQAVSISERWGLFLHLCAAGGAGGLVLEFGSCLGISSAYLGSGCGGRSFVTLEGSPDLARIAQATLDEIVPGAVVIPGTFDDGLDRLFARLNDERLGLDVAYVDGHHDEAATVHYVQRLWPHLLPRSLLILDDIHLYEEMWRAWQRVCTLHGCSAAVNLGRFGVLVRDPGADHRPRLFDLSRHTGWWPVGGSRHSTPIGGT